MSVAFVAAVGVAVVVAGGVGVVGVAGVVSVAADGGVVAARAVLVGLGQQPARSQKVWGIAPLVVVGKPVERAGPGRGQREARICAALGVEVEGRAPGETPSVRGVAM